MSSQVAMLVRSGGKFGRPPLLGWLGKMRLYASMYACMCEAEGKTDTVCERD